MLWNVTDFMLLYFIAEIQGIGAKNAGYILLASLVWSGLLDILLAAVLDKKNAHYQKVIIYSAPFCICAFSLLFIPITLPYVALAIYYVVITFLFRLGYSLVDIPHNAMLSTITKDGHIRTQLSALRTLFNAIAVLLFSIFIGHILGILESSKDNLKYFLIATSSLIMLLNIMASILPLWSVNKEHTPEPSQANLLVSMQALSKNTPLLILLLSTIISEAFVVSFYRSGVYFADLLLSSEKFATGLIMGLAAGKILAMPISVFIARYMEKGQLISLSFVGQAVCFTLFYAVHPNSIMVASFLFFLCGIFLGTHHMMVWSAIPDTIDYGKSKSGIANQALTFGVYHLIMRVGSGLSFVFIGSTLTAIGYQNINDSLVGVSFVSIIAIVAAIGAITGFIIMRFYPITDAVHKAALEKNNRINNTYP